MPFVPRLFQLALIFFAFVPEMHHFSIVLWILNPSLNHVFYNIIQSYFTWPIWLDSLLYVIHLITFLLDSISFCSLLIWLLGHSFTCINTCYFSVLYFSFFLLLFGKKSTTLSFSHCLILSWSEAPWDTVRSLLPNKLEPSSLTKINLCLCHLSLKFRVLLI